MTVEELRQQLASLPNEAVVVFADHEWGQMCVVTTLTLICGERRHRYLDRPGFDDVLLLSDHSEVEDVQS